MKSPIVSTRISEEAKRKLEELQAEHPTLTTRQLLEQIIEHHYQRLQKKKTKPSDAA